MLCSAFFQYNRVRSKEMNGTFDDARFSITPFTILLIVFILQLFDVLLEKLKRGSISNEENKLQLEIKHILMEANTLSTPSTFAEAAKLRRLAAAKQKELKKRQEERINDKKWFDYANILLSLKVFLYTGLCWQFWSTPVTTVPPHLLEPFGRILSWKGTDSSTGNYMVGIIPWLVLSSRVSKFLLRRLFKFEK